MANLKKTPLYEKHIEAGAKMVPFGGWEMPVQYSGIIEEHRQVRQNAGLFDVSHMGEVVLEGERALDSVQKLITNDAARLQPGQILYSTMCQEEGGIIDDLLVYRLEPDKFLLVVNAGNREKDLQWIKKHVGDGASVIDASDSYALLAVQGPAAAAAVAALPGDDFSAVKPFTFARGVLSGVDCVVSRTGYTGEDGFEIYCPADKAQVLWDRLLEQGVKPCGLGARDTLRLEASLPLYGHELTEAVTPLEAGLGWTVSWQKEFIGKQALLQRKDAGVKQKLTGLIMEDRGIPREGYPVIMEGRQVGSITSGSMAPYLDQYIAMAYLEQQLAQPGLKVNIGIRGREKAARVVKLPFYKREEKNDVS